MILEAIFTLLTALGPVLGLLARDYVLKRQAQSATEAPMLRQGEVDVEILTDKPALSVRLSRLHEAIRARRLTPK